MRTSAPRDARPAAAVSSPPKPPTRTTTSSPSPLTNEVPSVTSEPLLSPKAYIPPHLRNHSGRPDPLKMSSTQQVSSTQVGTAASSSRKPVMVKSRPGPGAQYSSTSSNALQDRGSDADADAVPTHMPPTQELPAEKATRPASSSRKPVMVKSRPGPGAQYRASSTPSGTLIDGISDEDPHSVALRLQLEELGIEARSSNVPSALAASIYGVPAFGLYDVRPLI
jgi:hypothetical protein